MLLAGDIESNPGPTLEKRAAEIRKMAADVSIIKENKKTTHNSLAVIHNKLGVLTHLESRITEVEDRITGIEASLLKFGQKIDDMENLSRRSNLINYGIPETENETTERLETEVVNKLIQDKLKVTISGIKRIHRLGAKSEEKTQPVYYASGFQGQYKYLRTAPN